MFKVIKIRKAAYFFMIIFILALPIAVMSISKNDEVALPVIMYHSVLKDTNSTGKYVVTPKSLEADLKYLSDRGYKSVSAQELIGFVNGDNELPEKPYLLTFDDGSYNNLTYVLPLLEKYDAYAVIAIVGSYSERFSELDEANPAYSYLRWCDIDEMRESGRIEFANHSYDLHSYDHQRMGARINKYEDKDEYKRLFEEDVLKTDTLLLDNCNINSRIYTYPFGAFCTESEEVLRNNGYMITFTCNEGINIISRKDKNLTLLKRFNRDGLVSTDEFFKKCKIC